MYVPQAVLNQEGLLRDVDTVRSSPPPMGVHAFFLCFFFWGVPNVANEKKKKKEKK